MMQVWFVFLILDLLLHVCFAADSLHSRVHHSCISLAVEESPESSNSSLNTSEQTNPTEQQMLLQTTLLQLHSDVFACVSPLLYIPLQSVSLLISGRHHKSKPKTKWEKQSVCSTGRSLPSVSWRLQPAGFLCVCSHNVCSDVCSRR